jgi:filamentous hemagglutinin family protein
MVSFPRNNEFIDFDMKSDAFWGFLFLTTISISGLGSPASAQIKPDQTLGNESSMLQGATIQRGAQRGNNLFHSFQSFSIGENQRIDFYNPPGVTNIITRVTDTPSKIDGVLGISGNANLFLINPNGISFGSGAKLEMSGTFVASTASGIKFADGTTYSTTATQNPILTMTSPIGLQFGRNPGAISLNNSGDLLTRDTVDSGYRGSSLLLIGGDINLDNSQVFLPGGKIELVAIGDQGNILINPQKLGSPRELSVIVPAGEERSNITIKNGSILSSDSSGILNGHISLQGRNIEISDPGSSNSLILARSNVNDRKATGGSVFLNATNNLIIRGDSGVSTRPRTGSSNNGGDIVVNAHNLDLLDGSFLVTGPNDGSLGNGGNIDIKVTNNLTIGAPSNGGESEISTGPRGNVGGNSGNITIETRRLIHRDGAQIFTDNSETNSSRAVDKLGNIKIMASESVEVSGVSSTMRQNGFFKATGITSFTDSAQDSGNIEIQTPHFLLRDGAVISAGTDQAGVGGSILITGLQGKNAESVELVGNSGIGRVLGIDNLPGFAGIGNGSRIRSITSSNSNAGSVTIKADRVTLRAGTRIDVGTVNSGSGNGGSIDIDAKTLELLDGGQLISTTAGSGRAGNIKVQATNLISSTGVDPSFEAKRTFLSFILAVNSQPATRSVLDEYLDRPNSNTQQILLDRWAVNNSNNIDRQILTNYLQLLAQDPGARVALLQYLPKNTIETGLTANLLLNSSKSSGIVSRSLAGSTGAGGNINIAASTVKISDHAMITANSDGLGQGGNVVVNAGNALVDRGAVTAETSTSDGGNININVQQSLLLRNQSQISASAAAKGRGGNVNIQAPQGAIVAIPIENSDISASALNGQGGTVSINALNVLGFSTQTADRFSNITATSFDGPQGIVTINTLGVDPSQGLQPEPITPGAPDLAQDCRAVGNTQVSKLVSSGKGGIAPNPGDLLPSSNLWTDPTGANISNKPSPTISEARGWVAGRGRTVVLTNQPNNLSPIPASASSRNCYAK